MVNGHPVDLTYPLHQDATVRVLTSKDPEALTVYRHSTAHLLAAAVTQLFPQAQCGIGPPTDEGFFYDFVVEHPFVPEDLDAIEKKMREIAGADLIYERQMWPREEAIDFFRKRGEPLKVQLIEEKTAGQKEVSVYTIKDRDTFVDFCVGPHVPSSGQIEGIQAAEYIQRLLERRCAESADAAHLRHGVLQRERAAGVPDAARGGQETRPSQARARAGPVHVSSVGGRRDVLAREGHDALQPARRITCATCCCPPAMWK